MILIVQHLFWIRLKRFGHIIKAKIHFQPFILFLFVQFNLHQSPKFFLQSFMFWKWFKFILTIIVLTKNVNRPVTSSTLHHLRKYKSRVFMEALKPWTCQKQYIMPQLLIIQRMSLKQLHFYVTINSKIMEHQPTIHESVGKSA